MLVFAKVIIMKIKNYIFIAWALAAMNVQADTLQLDLAATISMAQRQSPSVQSARNTFLSAYWLIGIIRPTICLRFPSHLHLILIRR